MATPISAARRRWSWQGWLVVAIGIALFAITLSRAGVDEVVAGLSKLGWGFALVLLLSGARFLFRARAWQLCVPRPDDLSTWRALESLLIGDAAGNLTPLGLVASESTKIVYARAHLTLIDTVSSIALENVFYTLTVCVVIGAGCGALLVRVDAVPEMVRLVALGGVTVFIVIALLIAALLVANVPVLTPAVAWLDRRGWLPGALGARRLEIGEFERRVLEFTTRHRRRVPAILTWELAFHAAGVAESAVAMTLLLGSRPDVVTVFVLEAVNRLITVAFKFVPLRLGVDEVGTGFLTSALGFGAHLGVTLAVVRKLRVLAWNGAGLALLAWQQMGMRRE
ncbi:MAG: lysylphosphatidylglycerol synthase domain-containing protein [Vicinamibacterales bacterium]